MATMSRMIAIQTKYVGPSNTKGSRIIANVPVNKGAPRQRITLSYDSSLNSDENHSRAAQELADRMGWTGELVGGAVERGYVFVFVEREARIVPPQDWLDRFVDDRHLLDGVEEVR